MSAVVRCARAGALRGLRRVGCSLQSSGSVRWAIPCSRLKLARQSIFKPVKVALRTGLRWEESSLLTQLESISQAESRKRPALYCCERPDCSEEPGTRRAQDRATNVLLPGVPLFGHSLDDPSGPGNGAESTVDGSWMEFFRPCGCWFERVCLCIIPAGPLKHLDPWGGDDGQESSRGGVPLGETIITCATHGDLAPYACCATGA